MNLLTWCIQSEWVGEERLKRITNYVARFPKQSNYELNWNGILTIEEGRRKIEDCRKSFQSSIFNLQSSIALTPTNFRITNYSPLS